MKDLEQLIDKLARQSMRPVFYDSNIEHAVSNVLGYILYSGGGYKVRTDFMETLQKTIMERVIEIQGGEDCTLKDVQEIKTTFTIELSEVKDCQLISGKGSLFWCVIRRDGEHLYTRQAKTAEQTYLMALQKLSKEFADLELSDKEEL